MKEVDEMYNIMKNIFYFSIIMLIVILVTGIILTIHNEKETEKYLQSDEYKQLIEKQEKCEHNYVTTGSGMGRGLTIYSKCSKCGKEIK